MSKRIVGLLMISFLYFSCGPAKAPDRAFVIKNASASKVLEFYDLKEPVFNTLNASLKGSYDDGKEKYSINVSLRIQKDETIWISAKLMGLIPLAKLMLTPDRVRFYDKINRQYFDGDYSLLSKWLGVEVEYGQIQNLLLGRLMFEEPYRNYNLLESDEGYVLGNKEKSILNSLLLIDKKDFYVKEEQFVHLATDQKLRISYSSYTPYDRFLFPEKIKIEAHKSDAETQIKIDYKTISFNEEVRFPFETPSGYKEIKP